MAQHFEAIPTAPETVPPVRTKEPEQRGERRVTVKQAGQVGAVMLGYKAPPGLHEDADALDVLAVLLASGMNSRLYRHLSDRGLTAQTSASLTRLRDPGLFYVLGLLAPDRTHEEVEAALYEVIAGVQEEGVAEDELERARNQLIAREAFGRDGPFAVAAQLNEAIATGDWKLYATYLDRIDHVTPDDVQRAAQTYLLDDQRTVGWYVPV